jgi:hypothetical protein
MTATDTFKEDVRKDPAELEREADGARRAVEHTLDELETRLSPTAVMNKVVDAVKNNGGEFGTNLVEQIRNNPVPAVLAGVGIAWLIAASNRPPSANPRPEPRSSTGDGMARGWSAARDSMRGAADSMRDAAASTSATLSDVGERARDAAGRLAGATRESWSSLAETSRDGQRTVAEGFSYLRDEQPLILGALAVAAGALLGGLLPRTEAENRWLGAASDDARQQLKETARRTVDAVQGAASDVAKSAAGGEDEDLDRSVGVQDEAIDADWKGERGDGAPAGGAQPRVSH